MGNFVCNFVPFYYALNSIKTKAIDCLLCNRFITTPAHISAFEIQIKEISILLQNEQLEHEREHLYVVKRLYVAYLEKLYIFKREMEEKNYDTSKRHHVG